jgi:hypothetical protein
VFSRIVELRKKEMKLITTLLDLALLSALAAYGVAEKSFEGLFQGNQGTS